MPPLTREEIMAEQFARGFQELKTIVENLRTDLHAKAVSDGQIKSELAHINTNLQQLNKVVMDVHSSDSLFARLISLENATKSLQKKVDEQEKFKKDVDVEEKKGKWQLRTAMITGTVSLIVGIITFLSHFIK